MNPAIIFENLNNFSVRLCFGYKQFLLTKIIIHVLITRVNINIIIYNTYFYKFYYLLYKS